jgi:hypothetical protein
MLMVSMSSINKYFKLWHEGLPIWDGTSADVTRFLVYFATIIRRPNRRTGIDHGIELSQMLSIKSGQ